MKTISVGDLYKRIQSGEKLNLIDVREPFEHDDFNIGGLLLPLGEIRVGETAPIDHLKNEEVILYCRSGNRSGQAALLLESQGFAHTVNVVGGMLAWKEVF